MNIKKVILLDGKEIYLQETKDGFIEVEKPIDNKRFIPKYREKYFCLQSLHNVIVSDYNADIIADRQSILLNNCFRTKEEAERKKEIFNFIHSKRKLFTIKEWNDSRMVKFSIFAKFDSKALYWSDSYILIYTDYHFETKEIAQEVIDFVGYDDWLKYVLNVYED